MGKGARRGVWIALAMTAVALLAVPQALGAAFTVNSTNDANDGVCNVAHCSLREAIIAANTTPGSDVIGFSILTGPQTIAPLAGLPALTEAVTIDGTTQPGFGSTPIIELDGSAAGVETDGLVLGAAGSVIRGLVINDYTEAGIRVSDGTTVERNYIGVDPTGTVDRGNRRGIWVSGTDNTIGGAGAGNLISGNEFTGISLDGGGNDIFGNTIGLDAAGTSALGNCLAGIRVFGSDNQIGSGAAGTGNVISGNQPCSLGGFRSQLTLGAGAAGNTIQGNRIGTNAAGTATIPAVAGGILISGAADNLVGGSLPGEPNVIATSSTNVAIVDEPDSPASDNRVVGNYIGTNADGTDFGVAGAGVVIQASGTSVGGTGGNDGNVIAHTGSVGVDVLAGEGNSILGNSIFDNDLLGIDLEDDGVTDNDEGDTDDGANGLQNFPTLTSAVLGSQLAVQGDFASAPSTEYTVELFRQDACDDNDTGYGEGEERVGTFAFTTGTDGTTSFGGSFDQDVAVGDALTATATDPDGNTSEFSACLTVTAGADETQFTVNSASDPGDGTCNEEQCTLREAIAAANADPGVETIRFAIGTGAALISPASALPIVTEPVVLDATTQPGYDGAPLIRVNGTSAGANTPAFEITAGDTTVRGFVLTGFTWDGVKMHERGGNTVEDNYIGIYWNGEGFSVAGNGTYGVLADFDSEENLIRRNVIGGNGFGAGGPYSGIGIWHDSNENQVEDNDVGTAPNGQAVANAIGVIVSESSDTLLRANTIANSTGAGVFLFGPGTADNEITENRIDANGGLGIDLGADGVTANDELDADTGANELQNFPALTAAGNGAVSGTLDAAASVTYRIDVYSSATCDPSDHGEGAVFAGTTEIETDENGFADFTLESPQIEGGDVVTATATDPQGNTSEFSSCLVASEEEEEAASGLTLTSDRAQTPAGARAVPLGAIPSSFLPVFSGRSAPVDSIPVDSIPVDSIGPGSTPVDSIPVDSIPVDSIPVDSIGFELVPTAGLEKILLSSLPLDWTAILGSSTLAARPLQTLTLADLRGDAAAWARFEAISFADSGLGRSILRSLPTAALLLGKATLAQLPQGAAWCAQLQPQCTSTSNTAVGLGIVGAPVDSIPLGSTPVDSIPVDSIPVDSIPVDSIDLAASRIGAILIRTLSNPNAVVDCARISCTGTATLANAAALSPSAIRPSARLSDLAGALGQITINDVILGMLPRSALDWEKQPIAGLQRFAPAASPLQYRLTFTLDCTRASGLTINVKLPTGSLVLPGTSRFAYGLGPLLTGVDPTTAGATGATWAALPGQPCAGAVATQNVRLDFAALPGFQLGEATASVKVTAGGTIATADDQAPLLVTQNWEANDEPAGAQTVAPDQLVIGHIASSGDRELFRVPVPTVRGTRTTFYLSHIPAGADYDLAIEQPQVASLQSNPVDSIPVDSIPIEDAGSSLAGGADAVPPETLQDIPVDSISVGSISANRGSNDEVAATVSQGETGFYTIIVSGYNGSRSDDPFVLRIRQTPPPTLPPCPARTFPNAAGTRGVLPATLPASTRTLFLFNRERLNRLYGATAVNALRAALLTQTLIGRPEIAGALLEVDGDAAVRTAYAAWDATPCAVDAANAVVRAINGVVARYRPALPNLRNVVLLGTDEALPQARILDPTTISPESDNAAALRFTTANLTRGNALYAAAATSHFLSDGPYGSTITIPWLNRQLYLPQLAVGRLVETPIEIQRQLELYVAANGILTPDSALTTAYDFLKDGGKAVKAGLDAVVPTQFSNGLLTDTWDAAQLRSAFTGKNPPDDVLSVNAHYDHWRLQPAAGGELLSTGSLPALPTNPAVEPAFARRVLFTMGCHGGLNVANSLLPAPLPPQALDWVEAYARQRSAVYVANTGFGYGDTISNALSERLMTLFAIRLDEQGPIGELWVKALADYHLGAGAYGVYDEKALQEATFYGLPFWRIGTGAATQAPVPPTLGNDPVSGLPVARMTVTPATEQNFTDRGRYWDDADKTLDVHYRPIQPRREVDVTVPGQTAKGVIITSLRTNDVADVDPATSLPTIDLGSHEPERAFRDTVFPANLVNLTTARRLGEQQQRLVLNEGQFRPSNPVGTKGIERLVLSIGVEVAYSASADSTAPQIRFVASTFAGGQAAIVVETAEAVRRVATLYNDTTQWRFAELTRVGTSNRWTANVPATQQVEVAAMAQDAAGNVGYSTNKGFNFVSVTDTAGPEILIESPASGGTYALGQVVRASYACSDDAGVASCTGTVPNGAAIDTSSLGEKVFVVTAVDLGGRQTRLERRYVVAYPFSDFQPPIKSLPALNVVRIATIPVKFDLGGNRGLDVFAPGYPKSQQIPCDSAALTEGDESTVAEPPGLTLTAGTYHYNWVPKAAWVGTCRQLVVKLRDGSFQRANFRFVSG